MITSVMTEESLRDAAFKEGDTLAVSIFDRLEKDGKLMLFIQKAEKIAVKAA
mgnify:CR=1 FL=1